MTARTADQQRLLDRVRLARVALDLARRTRARGDGTYADLARADLQLRLALLAAEEAGTHLLAGGQP